MNSTLLSYQNNDEISAIMNQKFASKFKSDSDTLYYPSQPKYNIKDDISNEDKLNYLFPSFSKEKIEQIFHFNKDINLEKGIELVKEMKISDNKINEINCYKYNYPKRIAIKRNYNSLLNQTQPQIQNKFMNIMNTNNINTNRIEEVNSRNNIQEQRNLEKAKEEERKKLELKTVDQIAEELLNSKDQEDLKNYLFIQLAFLNEKNTKDKKIQEMKEQINILDTDYLSLDKCLKTICRPINKKTCELSRLENKNSELEEKIQKTRDSIKYLEFVGNLFSSIKTFKKMDLN